MAQLSPLHNVETNQAIAYFPTTPKAISKMSHNLLQALLQELGAPMTGRSSKTMRNRVRLVIGLKDATDVDLPLQVEENDDLDGLNSFNGANEFQGGWDDDFDV